MTVLHFDIYLCFIPPCDGTWHLKQQRGLLMLAFKALLASANEAGLFFMWLNGLWASSVSLSVRVMRRCWEKQKHHRRLLTTFEGLEGSFHFIDSVLFSEGQELELRLQLHTAFVFRITAEVWEEVCELPLYIQPHSLVCKCLSWCKTLSWICSGCLRPVDGTDGSF